VGFERRVAEVLSVAKFACVESVLCHVTCNTPCPFKFIVLTHLPNRKLSGTSLLLLHLAATRQCKHGCNGPVRKQRAQTAAASRVDGDARGPDQQLS